jgi:5'-nucleotidase
MYKTLFSILITILLLAGCSHKKQQLLILCTNDVHSQIEPRDELGGFAARADLIDSLRKIYPLTLLLDAGDMVQGTPYFNFYHGRIEAASYNRLGYDAVTLGNHEFDMGIDTLAMWLNMADFQIVSCNYDVRNTPLESIVKPYAVFDRGGLKVGVIGFGVSPESSILPSNFEPIKYLNPIEKGNFYADSLKNAGVDFIIALSHLGYFDDKTGDLWLAQQSRNIDLILGGHTHDVRKDTIIMNANSKPVHYLTTQKAGLEMDKVIIEF